MGKKYKYEGVGGINYLVELNRWYYGNGQTALVMVNADVNATDIDKSCFGDEVLVVTVAVDVDFELGKDEIIVKNYSENEGVVDWLIENKIALLTGKAVSFGYVVAPVMKLLEPVESFDIYEG